MALVCGLVVAMGGFWTVRSSANHNETQLLRERAAELGATLSTSIQSTTSALVILGAIAPKEQSDSSAFELAASGLLKQGSTTVGLAAASGNVLEVSDSVGLGPSKGETLGDIPEALARQALSTGKLAVGVFRDGAQTRVGFVLPASVGGAVVYEEAIIDPTRPIQEPKGSPYSNLQVALYAGPRPAPSQLILSTESAPILSGGGAVTVQIPVGASTWTLVVGARQPLVGGLAGSAQWIVLGLVGLLALVGAAAISILTRRRAFALGLVHSTTRELRVLNESLEQLFSQGPVVALRGTVLDGEARIIYASPNMATVFEVDPAQLVAAGSLAEWIHPDDRPSADFSQARLAETSGTQTLEFRIRQLDGSYHWASVTVVNEIGANTEGAFVIYLADVTDHHAAQQAVREAMEAATAANRSKTEFLSRMSHELRTPLNAILGFGQLVRDGSIGQVREDTEHILRAGAHLLTLINEVLEISRIESGDLAISPEPVLVEELLGEAMDLIRPIAAAHEVHLATDGCKSCRFYAFADRQRTKQILLNLLSNAVKYNHRMGAVAVSCVSTDENRLLVKVSDTGPGIAPGSAEAVFAPFERLAAANTDVEGTGIGLALSRSLAEAMGATLTFESVVGQGSTFILDLPRAEGQLERFERLDDRASRSDPAANGSLVHKVLYIEDNIPNLRLIERVLSRRPEVTLVPAMQGRLGLALAHEHLPTLILLDLHLADIGGEKVLAELLADPVTAHIPVVIVSADATLNQVGRLLAAGAAAYLTKPINVDELLEHVDDAIRRADDHLAQC